MSKEKTPPQAEKMQSQEQRPTRNWRLGLATAPRQRPVGADYPAPNLRVAAHRRESRGKRSLETHFFVTGYSSAGVAATTGAALPLVRRDRSASSISLAVGAGDGAGSTAVDMV
jgi:hypothetical protein